MSDLLVCIFHTRPGQRPDIQGILGERYDMVIENVHMEAQ